MKAHTMNFSKGLQIGIPKRVGYSAMIIQHFIREMFFDFHMTYAEVE